jgi:hypothetical protein
MKSADENFDREIKRKLEGTGVKPPPGLFNKIVPPPSRKRGFFWFWVGGLFLIMIVPVYFYFNDNSLTIPVTQLKVGNKAIDPAKEKNINNANSQISGDNLSQSLTNLHESATEINNINTSTKKSISSGSRNHAEYENQVINSNSNSEAIWTNTPNNNKGIQTGTTDTYASLVYSPILYVPESGLPLQSVKIINPLNLEISRNEPSRFSVELYGGVTANHFSFKNKGDTLSKRLLDERKKEKKIYNGFNMGVKLLYRTGKNSALAGSVNYASLKENFKFDFKEFYNELQVDTHIYYILFPFAPPQQVTEIDSTISAESRNQLIQQNITISKISVGLEYHYSTPLRNFIIEPFAGIALDLLTLTKGTTNFNNEFENIEAGSVYSKQLQPSVHAGLQLGYNLNEKMMVFASGGYHYRPAAVTRKNHFYRENYNSTALSLGFRYQFFKKQAAKSTSVGSDIVKR